ncbi:MAG: hypothetical protein M2R45_00372 [Verrucomicrobia subdivision 3 bacterium]|nr:hypothetical protein [Limisphaerales bacterium]MCS1412870.1 hypothetical protein [Limisphaerales bacterium]
MSDAELRKTRRVKLSYGFPGSGSLPQSGLLNWEAGPRDAIFASNPTRRMAIGIQELLRLVGIPAPEVRMRGYRRQMFGRML